MKKKTLAIGAIALLAVGAGAYYYSQNSDSISLFSEEISEVTQLTYVLEQRPFQSTVTSIGELRASKSSTMTSPFSGKVVKLIPEGTRVEVDDPVVWFETEELEDELKDEDSQLKLDQKDLEAAKDASDLEEKRNDLTLESEKIKVDIARQAYQDAKQKFESETVLFEKNISPQTKLDEARLRMLQEELNLRNAQINLAKVEENLEANLRVKVSDIEKAELRLEKTQENYDEAKEKIDTAIIRASNPGDIAYLKIWKSGSVAKIAEGDQVWRRTNLLEIPDTTEMLAVIPINEIEIGRIAIDLPAIINIEAIPGKVYLGKVSKKSSVPITDASEKSWETSNGAGPREFEVSVLLDTSDPLFRQGMTATAKILIFDDQNAVPIPVDAVVKQEDQDGVYVMNDTVKTFQPINILQANNRFVVVEQPLPVGTTVLLNPQTKDEVTDVDLAFETVPSSSSEVNTESSSAEGQS